ncbi:M20 family metallo-hydrolase [Natronococcus occultus]|uniref:Amidase, hydantoinase/carbamoylase family n=1 Tax=Natronococcus occultus SP4 TaxID=694430 RepID=L0K2W6_9EURY|nr:M20 family metallo-hydrolase [Natronococcus occultus]AGB38885.1 amidase, hydantoinase/carbamoylase family [Natronococcus occultus SP4]
MTDNIHDPIDPAISNVNIDRLKADIETNAEFGRVETAVGSGRTLLPGTEENKRAREYLLDRFSDVGLTVHVDPVGNVLGRYRPADVPRSTPPVAAGSHLDSVPEGGIFDGPLGVYGALEAVRAIDEADVELAHPIDVVSFTAEEGGRFTDGVLGSSVAAGSLSPEEALELTDSDGTTLRTAFEDIGFSGTDTISAADWDSWLELHIEQGRTLEKADLPVGVVTDIVGTIRCHITVHGESNHSGTTSMADRVDALVPATELIGEIAEVAREHSDADGTTVATVGDVNVEPGATNVIPGKVTFPIDIRSTNYAKMIDIVDRIESNLARLERERGVETTYQSNYDIEPTPMSGRCQKALRTSADRIGVEAGELHSGAGHDTMQIARKTDAGLLFVPSEDGVSHTPREWTDWSICHTGVEVLAGAIVRLAVQDER